MSAIDAILVYVIPSVGASSSVYQQLNESRRGGRAASRSHGALFCFLQSRISHVNSIQQPSRLACFSGTKEVLVLQTAPARRQASPNTRGGASSSQRVACGESVVARKQSKLTSNPPSVDLRASSKRGPPESRQARTGERAERWGKGRTALLALAPWSPAAHCTPT